MSTIERLKDEGFWVAAATEHASDLIWQSNLKGKIALVMGNEGEGVSRPVLENCDFGVKLPQVGDFLTECGPGLHRLHVRVAAPELGIGRRSNHGQATQEAPHR
ncbi:MAG: TrmH family RNA methyltransferase [Adlercreutzia equolifaciens]